MTLAGWGLFKSGQMLNAGSDALRTARRCWPKYNWRNGPPFSEPTAEGETQVYTAPAFGLLGQMLEGWVHDCFGPSIYEWVALVNNFGGHDLCQTFEPGTPGSYELP